MYNFVKVLLLSLYCILSIFIWLWWYYCIPIFSFGLIELKWLVYSWVHILSIIYFFNIYVLTVTEKLLSIISSNISCFTSSLALWSFKCSIRMNRNQRVLSKWLIIHMIWMLGSWRAINTTLLSLNLSRVFYSLVSHHLKVLCTTSKTCLSITTCI